MKDGTAAGIKLEGGAAADCSDGAAAVGDHGAVLGAQEEPSGGPGRRCGGRAHRADRGPAAAHGRGAARQRVALEEELAARAPLSGGRPDLFLVASGGAAVVVGVDAVNGTEPRIIALDPVSGAAVRARRGLPRRPAHCGEGVGPLRLRRQRRRGERRCAARDRPGDRRDRVARDHAAVAVSRSPSRSSSRSSTWPAARPQQRQPTNVPENSGRSITAAPHVGHVSPSLSSWAAAPASPAARKGTFPRRRAAGTPRSTRARTPASAWRCAAATPGDPACCGPARWAATC